MTKWGTCTVTVDSDNNMRISAGKPVVSDSGELFLKPWNSETRSIVFEPGFDTSEVTSMTLMFFNCFSLEKLDLTHLPTSNVRDMSGMFFGNKVLEQLDVSCLDTSNVTNMPMMFFSCKNLKLLNLSGLNTSKAEDMNGGSEISLLFTYPEGSVDLSNYVPVRDGYTFVDWYADRDLKYRIRYIAMIEDATIYSKWEKLPVDYDLLRTAVEMTNGLNEEDFSIFLTAVKALAQIKSELIDISDDQNEVDSAAKEINTLLLNLRRSPKSDSLSQLW